MLRVHHHLLEDHTTDEMMSEEIIACLDGNGDLLPEPLPYRNFVALSRSEVRSEEYKQFFRSMLSDVSEPTTPFGLLDVRGAGAAIHEARRLLDPALAKRVRKSAHASRVSAASLFHLAWARVVAQCSGHDDVVIGTVLLGRMQAEAGTEGILGPLINSLPLRLRLGGLNVREGIRETHTLLAELLRREHASLAMAQACSGVAAALPLFSALINFRQVKIRGETTEAMNHAMAAAVRKMGLELIGFEERTNYPMEFPWTILATASCWRSRFSRQSTPR